MIAPLQGEGLSLWRHEFSHGATIWQLMFASDEAMLVQAYHEGSREPFFISLHPHDGSMQAERFCAGENIAGSIGEKAGFAGIETAFLGLAFFHAWVAGGPEHQGIWAVEASSGRHVWARPDLSFSANLGHALLVFRRTSFAGFPERHYYLLDPHDGSVLAEPGVDAVKVNRLRSMASAETLLQQVMLPEVCDPCAIELQAMPMQAASSGQCRCERLLYGSFRAVAFHEPLADAERWRSTLGVFIGDSLCHADCMDEGAVWPRMDNFLFRAGKLYYIKKKHELVCLSLQ